jgi:phage tail sheath gpL-like
MPISFNSVPNSLRSSGAYIEFDGTNAIQGLPQFNQKALIIGQKVTAGTATPNVPVLVTSVSQAQGLFGRAANLTHMFDKFKQNNDFIETWALPLDDNGAGVSAAFTLTASGTATETRSWPLYVAGRPVYITTQTGDTASVVAAAINTAINADGDLPVTSAVSGAVVTATSRHKGEVGNDLDFRAAYYGLLGGEALPAGISLAVAQSVTGTTNPTLTTALANLNDAVIYDYWVNPYTDTTSLNAINNELTARWGALQQVEGFELSARRATVANLQTFGQARNDNTGGTIGFNNSPSPAYEWAAALFGAVSGAAANDPARPFVTLVLKGILPPPLESQFTLSEKNTLLFSGISTFTVNANGEVAIANLITRYQKNAFNSPDATWLQVNTPLTLAYLRQSKRVFDERILSQRNKLVGDLTPVAAGQAAINPQRYKAEFAGLAKQWEAAGLVENADLLIETLLVERNNNNANRLDVLAQPDLVNQLEIIATKFGFKI